MNPKQTPDGSSTSSTFKFSSGRGANLYQPASNGPAKRDEIQVKPIQAYFIVTHRDDAFVRDMTASGDEPVESIVKFDPVHFIKEHAKLIFSNGQGFNIEEPQGKRFVTKQELLNDRQDATLKAVPQYIFGITLTPAEAERLFAEGDTDAILKSVVKASPGTTTAFLERKMFNTVTHNGLPAIDPLTNSVEIDVSLTPYLADSISNSSAEVADATPPTPDSPS